MTDQVYYKVQYPLKKAIEIIKKIDRESPLSENSTPQDIEKLNDFIELWENEGRVHLEEFIEELRKKN